MLSPRPAAPPPLPPSFLPSETPPPFFLYPTRIPGQLQIEYVHVHVG